jgi:ATP-dependent Clp protease ATP-binding subunit ClpA
MSDYHEMVNAVKGELAEAKVFRPEILGRIDKVYVFKPLEGMVVAEITVLKIAKLAREYGLEVHFIAPELIVRALMANEKVKRFGTRELERIVRDLFANQFIDAKEAGAKEVDVDVGPGGSVQVRPASKADTLS